MNYSELLKDPRWQKKRLEILQRDNFTCSCCGDTKTTLHVHHVKYQGNPWDVDSSLLVTFCKVCHFLHEFYKDFIIRKVSKAENGVTIIYCDGHVIISFLDNLEIKEHVSLSHKAVGQMFDEVNKLKNG